jgi:hypothetical protein
MSLGPAVFLNFKGARAKLFCRGITSGFSLKKTALHINLQIFGYFRPFITERCQDQDLQEIILPEENYLRKGNPLLLPYRWFSGTLRTLLKEGRVFYRRGHARFFPCLSHASHDILLLAVLKITHRGKPLIALNQRCKTVIVNMLKDLGANSR